MAVADLLGPPGIVGSESAGSLARCVGGGAGCLTVATPGARNRSVDLGARFRYLRTSRPRHP